MTELGNPRWPTWVRLVVLLAVFVLVDGVVGTTTSAVQGVPVVGLLVGLACAALVLLAYVKLVGFLERRPVTELPRDGAVAELRRGALLGLALFVVAIGLIAVFGGYRIDGWGSVSAFVNMIGMMCAASVAEELLFRGVLFRLVERLAGTWGALGVSAVAFGALHLVNPKATVWGALAIAVEGGLMLAAAYAATRTLWLPIGLHLAWNVAEGGIFGVGVSGSDDGATGLVKGVLSGPTALTGGGFGPEAGLVAILVCGVPTYFFLRAAHRRGRVLPRHHRRLAASSPGYQAHDESVR
jgi:uncharacterized protein